MLMDYRVSKASLRRFYKEVLISIPDSRRVEASEMILDAVRDDISGCNRVLSYSPMRYELDTSLLNRYLLERGMLCLPDDHYDLDDPGMKDSNGESLFFVDLVVTPALAIDARGVRLGRGGGYYDRLLSRGFNSVGLIYREQFSEDPLPKESHDVEVMKSIIL